MVDLRVSFLRRRPLVNLTGENVHGFAEQVSKSHFPQITVIPSDVVFIYQVSYVIVSIAQDFFPLADGQGFIVFHVEQK